MLGSSKQLTNQEFEQSEFEQLKLFSSNQRKLKPGSIVADYYEIIRSLDIEKSIVTYLVRDRRDREESCYVLELVTYSSKLINQERCQGKVKWLKRLSTHVQIPKLYDHVVESNQCYFVYEYVEGETLAALFHNRNFNEAEIVGLLQDLARIYDFLIKGNILDYNILPHNILRSKANNRYILSNFKGLFKVKRSASPLTVKQQKLLWHHHLKLCGKLLIQFLIGNYSNPQSRSQNIAADWKTRVNLSPHVQSILSKIISAQECDRFNSLQEIMAECQPLLKIQQVIGDKYRLIRYLGDHNGIKTYIARNLDNQQLESALWIVKQMAIYEDNVEIVSTKIEKVAVEVDRANKSEILPKMELIKELDAEQQELYLVRGYCQGTSLTKKLSQNPNFSLAEVVELLAQSLQSLVAIHEQNLIHQNIKPTNLIVSANEDPILFVDLGILNNFQPSKNMVNNADGYKPPEQLIGRPTQSSDIYALGMVIIKVLEGLSWSDGLSSFATDNLVWQNKLSMTAFDWLVPILEKMIHTDVANRYQFSLEVLQDVKNKGSRQQVNLFLPSDDSPKYLDNVSPRFVFSVANWTKNILAVVVLLLCSFGCFEFLMPTLRPRYLTYQGYQQLSSTQPEKALANFEKALNLKPQKNEALLGKAEALSKLRRFAPALSIYRNLLVADGSDIDSLIGRGDLHFDVGNYAQALGDYNRVLKSQPDHLHALARKGKILYSLSRYREAFTVQEKALANDLSMDVKLLSDSADTALALGKNHRALNQFTRVENIAPLKPYLWQNKVLALQHLERFEDAIATSYDVLESYEHALKQEPENLRLRLGQGEFFQQLERDRMASKAYEAAIAINPNSDQAWLGLSKVFLGNQKYAEALHAVERAIVLNGESFQAWHTKGVILQQNQEDLEKALVAYNQAISLNKYFFPAWRDRSFAFIAQKDYAQAVQSLKKAVKIAPHDLGSWLKLSVAFQKVPNLDGSLNALDRVIALQPRNSEHWLKKGSLVELQKKYTQACNIYLQAMEVAPDFKITGAINRLGCDAKN